MKQTIAPILLGLIVIVLLGRTLQEEKEIIASMRDTLTTMQERIVSLEDTLSILLEDNEELAAKVADEETQRRLLEDQQNTLAADIDQQFSLLEDEEVARIVKRWEPFVYQFECTFESRGDGAGSAIVENKNGTISFLSNKHIIDKYEGVPAESCAVIKPREGKDIRVIVPGDRITLDEKRDLGSGTITESIPAFPASKRCATTPSIGDHVVIIGYPTIGASESITATEGIISGFSEEYYITSAKIEKGNSGSAAIYVEDDCLLGLPTIVVSGRLESLARILPLTP